MQFRNDKQRMAVMASMQSPRGKPNWLRPGTAKAKDTVWGGHWNPLGLDTAPTGEGKGRRSVGRVMSAQELVAAGGKAAAITAAVKAGKEGTAALEKAGFSSGLGLGGMAGFGPKGGLMVRSGILRQQKKDRRQALKEAAMIGGIGAAVALPAGYLALKTGVGNRAALAFARRARPGKALNSFLGFGQTRAKQGAEAAIVKAESGIRHWMSGKIDRGVTRLTGVDNITAELSRRSGELKSRYMFGQSPEQKARLIREMGGLDKRRLEVWTGPGLLDQADAVFKRGINRVASKMGIPVTGPMQRSGSRLNIAADVRKQLGMPAAIDPLTGAGDYPTIMRKHAEINKSWATLRKYGVSDYGGTSMARVRNTPAGATVFRRRGGAPQVTPRVGGMPKELVPEGRNRGMKAHVTTKVTSAAPKVVAVAAPKTPGLVPFGQSKAIIERKKSIT